MSRQFDTPPHSQIVAFGKQVELRCHPPSRSKPSAHVSHWLKNGRKIDPLTQNNFIQSAAGHLLLLQARTEDSGNYTCVASNGYVQRASQVAKLTVYSKLLV